MSELKRLVDQHGVVVQAGYEVLIRDEDFARKLASKYGASVKESDDGWLVQKPVPAESDDDPIIAAIKTAIQGLS